MSEQVLDIQALLEQILQDPEAALKSWRGGGIPVQLLRDLFSKHDHFEVDYFLAGYSDTPSRILETLCEKTSSSVILCLLANHPRTPKAALLQMCHHESKDVRKAVAGSKWISPQSALVLCEDPDPHVRAALAENSVITPRIQAHLSLDTVPFVRTALLKENHLDEEIQKALCDDVDVTVQAAALLSPKLSPSCMLEWADSDDGLSQRLLLARNQLPEKVLESLLFSRDADVQREAISRKSLTEDEMIGFSQKGDVEIRKKVASCAEIPGIVQAVLANDESQDVRMRLAANRHLEEDTVARLLAGGEDAVLDVLCGNEAVPLAWLRERLAHESGRRWLLVAGRDGLSSEELAEVIAHGDEGVLYGLSYLGIDCSGVSVSTARLLGHHSLPSLRAMGAGARSLPLVMMAELAKDPSPMVRLALAGNETAPMSLLSQLQEDEDGRVREQAKKTLSERAVQMEAAEAAARRAEGQNHVEDGADGEPLADEDKPGLLKRLFGRFGHADS